MVPTIHVDTTVLQTRIHELQAALGAAGQAADLTEILKDETRRLIAGIVKLTPPQTQAIGLTAINRDLGSLFTGVKAGMLDTIGSAHGLTNVDTYITTKKGKRLRLKWERIVPNAADMKRLHYPKLNARGHAPSPLRPRDNEWPARNVVTKEDLVAYQKQVGAHVGRWKASWAASALALGAKSVPRWIRRHIDGANNAPGSIGRFDFTRGDFPRITFGSRAPGVKRQTGIIASVVRIRTEAIKRRIRLIVSSYNRDLSRKMKIERAAHKTEQGGQDAIG